MATAGKANVQAIDVGVRLLGPGRQPVPVEPSSPPIPYGTVARLFGSGEPGDAKASGRPFHHVALIVGLDAALVGSEFAGDFVIARSAIDFCRELRLDGTRYSCAFASGGSVFRA